MSAEDAIGSVDSVKGYSVVAADGPAGTVAWASYAPGDRYLVVTVRHGLRSTHHLLPGSAVLSVDPLERTLRIALTRAQIDETPTHDDPSGPVDVDFLAGLWPTWLNERR